MTNNDEQRFNSMEEILQNINSRFISLPYYDVKRNNRIIKEVINNIIEKLKKNPLFNELYRENFYGGSFFCGLKVGTPNEYDIDILFTLPKGVSPELVNSDKPGFVFVHVPPMDVLDNEQPEAAKYRDFQEKLLDDYHCLVSTKTSAWMESLIDIALDEFPNGQEIRTRYCGTVYATVRKTGPAFTLNLQGTANEEQFIIDIDLVPCFKFNHINWPNEPYRPNPVKSKPEFFVVPKRPYRQCQYAQRYWSLSFQQQENALINNLKTLKPALRLLKKLRDTQNHSISSYHIKTIFVWEAQYNNKLWKKSLSYVFMIMLRKYKEYIENGVIPYFWNEERNLIEERPGVETLSNIRNRLHFIMNDLERNPANVATYLLKPHEYRRFQYFHSNNL